jgi:4'-phosphopantetheinyl transferase
MSQVSISPWQPPPLRVPLDADSVHVWRFSLALGPHAPDLLDPQEKSRAQRLRSRQKAAAFIAGRTRLRQILSLYLMNDPRDARFECNMHGKPSLSRADARGISFNLSHSGEWGLCAVVHGRDVGVDLEQISDELDFEPLAERFFSGAEFCWLKSSPGARRRRNFYRLWTRKESWLKGKGGGFSEPKLALDPAHIAGTSAFAGDWWLSNVAVKQGYVGALAVAGRIARIERWDWNGA